MHSILTSWQVGQSDPIEASGVLMLLQEQIEEGGPSAQRRFRERLMSCAFDILWDGSNAPKNCFPVNFGQRFQYERWLMPIWWKKSSSFADRDQGATFCGSSNSNGNPLTMQNIPLRRVQIVCRIFGTRIAVSRTGLPDCIRACPLSCCILMVPCQIQD